VFLNQLKSMNRHARRWIVPAMTAGMLLCAMPACIAATFYISPSGDDNNPGTQASPIQTIQSAVNNASTGDTILLEDGKYAGHNNADVTFSGKTVTIKSLHGAAAAIIDCNGSDSDRHSAFTIKGEGTAASPVVLSGLTIQNGYTPSMDASVITVTTGYLTLKGCKMTQCTGSCVTNAGPGTLTVQDCEFTDNTTFNGHFFEGDSVIASKLGNWAYDLKNGTEHQSLVKYGTLIVQNCVFDSNFVGVAIVNAGKMSMSECSFTNEISKSNKLNTDGQVYADARRACAFIVNGGPATVKECKFSNGSAETGGAIDNGGHGSMSLVSCTFTHNESLDMGMNRLGGGAIYNSAEMHLKDCTLTNNTALYRGGAIDNAGYTLLTLDNCRLSGNSTENGGGVYNAGTATVSNCVFDGNTAFLGGAVYTAYCADTDEKYKDHPRYRTVLRFCSLVNNIGKTSGGALYNAGNVAEEVAEQHPQNAITDLIDDILWGNSGPANAEIANSGTLTATHCDIQLGLSGTGNIKSDPLFKDPANGSFILGSGSPCMGAGMPIPGITTDFGGHTRRNPPAIGAFEGGN